MVEQFFPSLQVKLSVIISNKWYIRVAERFKTYEIRKYQETLKNSWNYCLVLCRPPEIKILSALVKIS